MHTRIVASAPNGEGQRTVRVIFDDGTFGDRVMQPDGSIDPACLHGRKFDSVPPKRDGLVSMLALEWVKKH